LGLREKKYEWLVSNELATTEWEESHPHSPFYFFIPRDERFEDVYSRYWKVTDIFPINSVGIVTSRDKFVTDFDKNPIRDRIRVFRNLTIPDEVVRKRFKLRDTSTFKLGKSRKTLSQDKEWERHFTKILYRPFDVRHIYYSNAVVERPLFKTMRHMAGKNLAMCVGRAGQVVGLEKPWNIVFCSEFIADFNLFYRGGNVNFPLYICNNKDRATNISNVLWKKLENAYSASLLPEQVFFYIYSVLYSNFYRIKYAEFLKYDYPRIPFTTDYALFTEMSKLGRKLVKLHILNLDILSIPITKFQGKGDNIVRKPLFIEEESRIYINKVQYFEGIEQELWEYQIGGYQVLYKWLKDRKGRELSLEEIKHYCRVVTALKRTIEIQEEIDEVYPAVEKEIIEFKEKNQNASLDEYKQ